MRRINNVWMPWNVLYTNQINRIQPQLLKMNKGSRDTVVSFFKKNHQQGFKG